MATTESASQLVLRRTYNATREQVFEAWTRPDLLARWYTPGEGWTVSVPELDARVGGRYRVLFGPPGESPYEESGEYLEVAPGSRLAFTSSLRRDGELLAETRCRVEFLDVDGGTEVVVTEEGFAPEHMEARRQGWGETLDHLDGLFSGV
jgi:uncharacterized protein YndB with AHSA1/START domain